MPAGSEITSSSRSAGQTSRRSTTPGRTPTTLTLTMGHACWRMETKTWTSKRNSTNDTWTLPVEPMHLISASDRSDGGGHTNSPRGCGPLVGGTAIIYRIFPHFLTTLQSLPVSPSTPPCIYDTSDMNTTTYNNDPTSCSHCPACTDTHEPTFRLPKNDRCPCDRCPQAWPVCPFRLYDLTGTVYAATH